MTWEFDPTALGFSVVNACYLARACAAAGQRQEEQVRAAAAELGLEELVYPFQYQDSEEGVDLRGLVAAHEDRLFLIFAGGDHLDDYLREEWVEQKPGFGGLIHTGFAKALNLLWPELEPALAEWLPERDLWLAGYDVGGALAVLAAARLHEEGRNIEAVYTYGAPRVGNRSFYESYQPLTYRLVNNNDLYAHVPPEVVIIKGYHYYEYKHVGTLRYLDRHGLLGEGTHDWERKKQLIRERLLRQGPPPTQWFQDHHLSSYLTALEMNL